ncbi:MAG: hypothetical protein ACWA41_00350 [Putridiphycobacter sp.]
MLRIFLYSFVIIWSANVWATPSVDSLKSDFKNAIIKDDQKQQEKIANQLYSKYSPQHLFYYQTLLKDLNGNSILVTNGYEDTYPTILLQLVKEINPKVDIISLSLLKNEKYKKRVIKSQKINLSSPDKFVAELMNIQGKTVYFSSTIPLSKLSQQAQRLTLIGLAFEKDAPEQLNKLNAFWQYFKLKYNNKVALTPYEQKLYRNFLPPLLTLIKLNASLNIDNTELKKMTLNFSKKINKEKEVEEILTQYNQ